MATRILCDLKDCQHNQPQGCDMATVRVSRPGRRDSAQCLAAKGWVLCTAYAPQGQEEG